MTFKTGLIADKEQEAYFGPLLAIEEVGCVCYVFLWFGSCLVIEFSVFRFRSVTKPLNHAAQ